MAFMINHPFILLLACLAGMWLMALFGIWLRQLLRAPKDVDKESLGYVVSATLTLMALVIGFTFSMAATRYDQRRLYEEGEANAIGTEYVRADLLAPSEAIRLKLLLREYLVARIAFYESGYGIKLTQFDARSAVLQGQLWRVILPAAAAKPTPVTALVISGMNDVLNSQGYTQFSWWNRIPASAWGLLIAMAVCANILIGYASERSQSGNLLLFVLPLIISVSFFLVADIDSPRGGIIRVHPVDLISLQRSLPGQI